MTTTATPSRRRMAMAALAIALLVIMLSARRTAMDAFFHHSRVAPDSTTASDTALSQSIIAVHIDPETNQTGTIDLTPPPPPPPPVREDTATVRPEKPRPDAGADLDLDDLLDRDAGARSGPSSTGLASIPPRPVEITWPETRQLKQCIGQSVTVRIRVSEQGRVKDVEIVPSAVLPACADAALAAARRIRFEPGRQGGVPVTMWTEVRIDFQRRD